MNNIFTQTFCNTAWYELHIYYNGDFGLCCAEAHKPDGTAEDSTLKSEYNIENMSMTQWYNSDLMRNIRKKFLTTNSCLSNCSKCYLTEGTTNHSRRHEQLQKSAIFPKSDFEESYRQSPHYNNFEHSRDQGYTTTLPIDLHVDLGNFCNCACKMCHAPSSSTIAKQEVKWGIESSRPFLGTDWTKNSLVWYRFLEELVTLPIKNLHLMGGETLLTPRFEQLVDYLIQHKRFDVNLSFVTNGTVYNESLMQKLQKFGRIGIEVSAETMDARNEYIRLGTDNNILKQNIKRFAQLVDNERITITMRPAPSSLSIGTYYTLLEYCIQNNYLISSTQLDEPPFLEVKHLPDIVKQKYLHRLEQFIQDYNIDLTRIIGIDFNRKAMNEQSRVIAHHSQQAIDLLSTPRDADSDEQLQKMVAHSRKWDSVYKFDMLELYPEFASFVDV